jgi:hypothetical protein
MSSQKSGWLLIAVASAIFLSPIIFAVSFHFFRQHHLHVLEGIITFLVTPFAILLYLAAPLVFVAAIIMFIIGAKRVQKPQSAPTQKRLP